MRSIKAVNKKFSILLLRLTSITLFSVLNFGHQYETFNKKYEVNLLLKTQQ